jgi:hypothetical protein
VRRSASGVNIGFVGTVLGTWSTNLQIQTESKLRIGTNPRTGSFGGI